MDFPTRRFLDAGATPEDLAVLQAEFDRLPLRAQASRLERYAEIAVGDIAEIIHTTRAAALEAVEQLADEPAPENEEISSNEAPKPEQDPQTPSGLTLSDGSTL